jgi:hypothetical protein
MIFFCGSVYFGQLISLIFLCGSPSPHRIFFSITISRATPVEKPWARVLRVCLHHGLWPDCVLPPRMFIKRSFLQISLFSKTAKPWKKCPDSSCRKLWHLRHVRAIPNPGSDWLPATLRCVSHSFHTWSCLQLRKNRIYDLFRMNLS